MKISSAISHASVKIYVNDILHIHFRREKFIGLQSWRYEKEEMFYIEINLTDGVMTCDYDRSDMWTEILTELNKAR